MPAFINSVRNILPGFGSPAYNGSVIGVAITTATTTTITIAATTTTPSGGTPFNTDGAAGPRAGYYRIRTSGVNAAATTSVIITVTDGTNTWQVGSVGITAAGTLIDETKSFNVDEPQSATLLGLTGITFSVTSAGSPATQTVDVEVSMTN